MKQSYILYERIKYKLYCEKGNNEAMNDQIKTVNLNSRNGPV